MKYAKRIFPLLAVAGYLLIVAGCGQKSNCSGISFGGAGSSGGSAGLSGPGTCVALVRVEMAAAGQAGRMWTCCTSWAAATISSEPA